MFDSAKDMRNEFAQRIFRYLKARNGSSRKIEFNQTIKDEKGVTLNHQKDRNATPETRNSSTCQPRRKRRN